MNAINELKTKIINHCNQFIEEMLEFEGKTLRLELSGIGIPKVKDIYPLEIETKNGDNAYNILQLVLQSGTDDTYADCYPDFRLIQWNNNYDVYWDSFNGTEVYKRSLADDQKNEQYKIIELLNQIGLLEHLEEVWEEDCEAFIHGAFRSDWESIEEDIKETFPGIVSAKGDDLNSGEVTFSTGATLYGLSYNQVCSEIHKHKKKRHVPF